ncbi:MAG: hypothetical protein K9J85_11615, partial [Desulfobacteraceae bacterium]|nr:hypothetical protein [Desulfobacteraceae bacterium]
MNVTEFLSNLPEKTPVAVNLTTTTGEMLKHNATAVLGQPAELEVRFPPGVLPEPGSIDTTADCLVFIETGEIVTLICTIEEVTNKELIRVTVQDVIQHVEKREFFRGSANRISVSWREKGPSGQRNLSAARGENISCGGMLMVVDRE